MAVRVEGLDEFRRELKRIDPKLGKALAVAHQKVSERVISSAAPAIRALPSPGGAKAMAGLKPGRKQTKATIILSGSNPTIRASVLGTLSHKVYGRTISGSGPWQAWLGNSWSPEDLYGLGPVLTTTADTFAMETYADAFMKGLDSAFPD